MNHDGTAGQVEERVVEKPSWEKPSCRRDQKHEHEERPLAKQREAEAVTWAMHEGFFFVAKPIPGCRQIADT